MCASKAEALKIAGALLEAELVACANVVGPADSVFRWQGKVETETEFMMLLKTRSRNIPRIISTVTQLHSYELPEVSAIPITGGSERFLSWVAEET